MPLIHLGFLGSPPLGLCRDGLVLSLSFGVCSSQRRGYGGDLQTWKVSVALEFLCLLSRVALKLDHCHASNLCLCLLVASAEAW